MRSNFKSMILWAVAGTMALAGVGAVVWSFTADFSTQGPGGGPVPGTQPSALVAATDSVEQLEHIWKRDVRQSLNGSNAPLETIVPAQNTAPAAMPLKLVATAVDEQKRCAIFTDPEQKALICIEGQTADGVKVVSIETRKVIVDFHGQRLDLLVPDQLDAPGPMPTAAIPDPVAVPATTPVSAPSQPPSGMKGAPG